MASTKNLSPLATIYRAAQFYAHMAHNLTHGETFYQDHDQFGGLYGVYEDAYDGVIERMIGGGDVPDIPAITLEAAKMLEKHSSDAGADSFYQKIHGTEKRIRAIIDTLIPGQSQGTTNFLQGLSDESEVRSYKIGQRLK